MTQEPIESHELHTKTSTKKRNSESNTELINIDSDIIVESDIDNKTNHIVDAKIELKSKLSLLVHPTRASKKKQIIPLAPPRKGNVMVIGKSKNKSVNFF